MAEETIFQQISRTLMEIAETLKRIEQSLDKHFGLE